MVKKKNNKTKLKLGQTSNAHFHRCTQVQCGYYREGNCKPCEKCGADPYHIDNDCKTCHNCECVPGELRWDNGSELESGEAVTEKDVMEMIKAAAEQRLQELKATEPSETEEEPKQEEDPTELSYIR